MLILEPILNPQCSCHLCFPVLVAAPTARLTALVICSLPQQPPRAQLLSQQLHKLVTRHNTLQRRLERLGGGATHTSQVGTTGDMTDTSPGSLRRAQIYTQVGCAQMGAQAAEARS